MGELSTQARSWLNRANIAPRYANAAIGPVGTIIKTYIYPEVFVGKKGKTNSSLLSSMSFAGIVVGQLSECGLS